MSLPNLDEYRKYLSDMDMTDAQKDQCILALWEIIGILVDKEWGIIGRGPIPADDAQKTATKMKRRKPRQKKISP